jgi:hypothetical protein
MGSLYHQSDDNIHVNFVQENYFCPKEGGVAFQKLRVDSTFCDRTSHLSRHRLRCSGPYFCELPGLRNSNKLTGLQRLHYDLGFNTPRALPP